MTPVHAACRPAADRGRGRSVSAFALLVEREFERLQEAPVASLEEGYARLLREVDERSRLAKIPRGKEDRVAALEELVELAALVQLVAEDVILRGRPGQAGRGGAR